MCLGKRAINYYNSCEGLTQGMILLQVRGDRLFRSIVWKVVVVILIFGVRFKLHENGSNCVLET
jgi:hypothetical protein